MISLIIPPKDQVNSRFANMLHHGWAARQHFRYFLLLVDLSRSTLLQVSRVNKMLGDEYGTASNIKVQSAPQLNIDSERERYAKGGQTRSRRRRRRSRA